MSKQVRINISTLVNKEKVRKETRDGREVIVVPSATLPDNVVMNKVRYPAEVIAKGFKSLEGTPAPLGHPTTNSGEFLSAIDPRGMVRGFIGAWNENVRRENGRVFVDKVIDVEYANQLEGGREVLTAINEGKPIHTSTGLFATMHEVKNSEDGAEWEVDDMLLDHDAILLNEPGAATPDQGVGMLVNKAVNREGKTLEVINSYLQDEADRELTWAAEHMLRAVERSQRVPLLERIVKAIKETVSGTSPEPETSTNQKDEQAMNDAQFNDLSGKITALTEGMAKVTESLTNAITEALKPLTEQMTAQANAAKEAEEAKRTELVNKVTAADLLSKELAEKADTSVLEALLANAAKTTQTPGLAFRLNAAAPQVKKEAGEFALPKAE